MNIILEIQRTIKDFELQTGIKPNLVVISQSVEKSINRMLKSRIALIESYPEVFQLAFRVSRNIKGFQVNVCLSGKG